MRRTGGQVSIGGSPIRTNITHSGSIVARTPPAKPQAPCASEKVAITMNRSQECDKPLIRYARNIWTGTDALWIIYS